MTRRIRNSISLLILMQVLVAGAATAETVYVATDGDDGAGGGPGDPFATIQHAVGAVAAGDTVYLYDGRFAGPGNREVDLQAKALRIMSVSGGPAACIIDCGGLDGLVFNDSTASQADTLLVSGIRFTNADRALWLRNGSFWNTTPRGCVLRDVTIDSTVTGLQIRNHELRGEDIRVTATGTGAYLLGCRGEFDRLRIRGADRGLRTDDLWGIDWNLTLRDAELVGNGYGVDALNNFQDLVFEDCRVDSNTTGGMFVYSTEVGRATLLRTTVNHNQGHGVHLLEFASLEAADAEISGNAGDGVLAEHSSPANVTLDDVTIHDNGGWGVRYLEGFLGSFVMRTSSVRGNAAGGCRTSVPSVLVEESLVAANGGTGLWLVPGSGEGGWGLSSVTIADNAGNGLISQLAGGSVANTLIAANDSLGFVVADTTGLVVACTDIHGNALGNWVGNLASRLGTDGNRQQDPQFCALGDNPYALVVSSPCAAANSPCGLVGRFDAACEGVFVTTAELHEYDPVSGGYIGEYQYVPVTVEGVVFSAPGTYSSSGGGYLQDATGGVNFWHFIFPASIQRGDRLRLTGPYWYAGNGEMFIGNPAWTVLETGVEPAPTSYTPGELVSDLGHSASFVSVSGVVDSLTVDRFLLRDGPDLVEVRRTSYTGVSFEAVTAGESWTVLSPALRDGPALFLSPREQGDLIRTPVPRIWYVAVDGDDGAAGTYLDPLATMAEAFLRTAPGDTVSLHDGIHQGAGNRDLTFPAHAVVVRSTTGDADACIIDCGGATAVYHRAFTVDAGQDTTTVLEGLRIRNGNVQTDGGALLLAEGTHLLIQDCVFEDNTAVGRGGAVMKLGDAIVVPTPQFHVRRCRFEGNSADEGGGLYVWYPSNYAVQDCDFTGNAAGRGGGIFSYWETRSIIERCAFTGNSAVDAGGALDLSMEQYPQVSECTFQGNSASRGGALANRLGYSKKSGRDKSFGDFVDCLFEENSADEGGVYYAWQQSAYSFDNCVFRDNEALIRGGAVAEIFDNEASFDGCLFVGNSAPEGGAFFRDDLGEVNAAYSSFIRSCTIVGNEALVGSGISVTGVTTSPVWGDPRGYYVEDTIIAGGLVGAAIAVSDGRAPTISCTDIHGNAGGDWTTPLFPQFGVNGNFSEDPCFCEPAAGTYDLCGASPCLPGASPFACTEVIGAFGQGCGTPSDVGTPDATPASHRLVGAYPNPFNPMTTITYDLSAAATVTLRIYDPRGRLVQVLEDRRPRGPGRHEAVWRGRDLQGRASSAGVYMVRMEAGHFAATERVTLLK